MRPHDKALSCALLQIQAVDHCIASTRDLCYLFFFFLSLSHSRAMTSLSYYTQRLTNHHAGKQSYQEVAGRPAELAPDVRHAMLPLLPFIATAPPAKADRQELGVPRMLDAEAVGPFTMPWASSVLSSIWLDEGAELT